MCTTVILNALVLFLMFVIIWSKRTETLIDLAEKTAAKVKETGQRVRYGSNDE